ncbi:MAG: hypothetical protein K6A68_08740 [Clostridiales bacterium]|nr:hypothetical protein [Clostridiales bacterium]
MKKAVGMAALNLAGIILLWTLMNMSVAEISGGDFLQNMTDPLFFVSCCAAALITAVFTFVKEKRLLMKARTLA